MDRHAPIVRMWDHACCGDYRWSAAPRCDRCGVEGSIVEETVSIADAMSIPHAAMALALKERMAVPE